MIDFLGAIVCTTGLALGIVGLAAPQRLMEMRKRFMGIEDRSCFFDSHPFLERIGSLGLLILCLLGLIKIVLRI